MSTVHVIAMDTHSQTTDICIKTRANTPGKCCRVRTTIPEIAAVIRQVPGTRELVLEEGPLAGWLLRHLQPHVTRAVACDGRKNALIAKDGDKDDPIDASKLADLYLGGFIRPVHHPEHPERCVLKQTVGLYHEPVGHRVAQANKLMGLLKQWGIMAREKDFPTPEALTDVLLALGEDPQAATVARHVHLLWRGHQEACRQENLLHKELVTLAQAQEVVVRWQEVPGIGPIRGITLYAYLDTPWRFKGKRQLWKYMGIGLVREKSGAGHARVHVDRGCNYLLKNVILGAAATVIQMRNGVFYARYQRWREAGLGLKNARRNVARDLAATLLAMWKNGRTFDPQLVGQGPGV